MNLIEQLDKRIDELRDELAQLPIRLVNIKSVQGQPLPGAPFGEGPRRVLDDVLAFGRESGFYTTDYGVGVISLALKDTAPDLGIWLHGDVVPEGADWQFDPYNAVEYKGCVIGRGATDNKGQLAVIFLLLRTFKEMGIDLKYNPALYVGSNEETGMCDLIGLPGNPDAKGFLNVATVPRLSLVPDGGFPVGYGGKGAVTLKLRSNTPLHGCVLTAGQTASPGLAEAVFDTAVSPAAIAECTVDGHTLTAWTAPRHGAHPDPNGNMITVLSNAVLENKLSADEDTYIWKFFKNVSQNTDGSMLGIATTSRHMTPLSAFPKQIDNVDGYPEITLNIRYPDGITAEEIIRRTAQAGAIHGFTLTDSQIGTPVALAEKDTPAVRALCAASADVLGEDKPPFTVSGGTYAHRLPNGYVFGMSGNLPPDDFPKDRGGAHGIDEAVSLDRLQRAMRIYARALLNLNETEW